MTDSEILKTTDASFNEEEREVIGTVQALRALTSNREVQKTLDDVLALFRHKKEIINGLIAGQETLQKCIAQKDAEIERLKKVESNILDVMRENIEQTQAEAIKEFAESLKTKLKDEIWDWVGDMGYEPNRAYAVGRVWSIINEMVGDK